MKKSLMVIMMTVMMLFSISAVDIYRHYGNNIEVEQVTLDDNFKIDGDYTVTFHDEEMGVTVELKDEKVVFDFTNDEWVNFQHLLKKYYNRSSNEKEDDSNNIQNSFSESF